jgi:hypothetical protein
MRIAFILIGNSRRSNYLNGETLRYGGGGGSGTDTSTILVAEYLASQGNDVVIVTEKLEPLLEKKYAEEGKFFPKGEKIRGCRASDRRNIGGDLAEIRYAVRRGQKSFYNLENCRPQISL